MGSGVNAIDALSQHHVDGSLGPKGCGSDHDAFKRLVTSKIVFGQWRALIGIFRLGIHYANAAFIFGLPKCNCRLRAAMAAADDENIIMHQ